MGLQSQLSGGVFAPYNGGGFHKQIFASSAAYGVPPGWKHGYHRSQWSPYTPPELDRDGLYLFKSFPKIRFFRKHPKRADRTTPDVRSTSMRPPVRG